VIVKAKFVLPVLLVAVIEYAIVATGPPGVPDIWPLIELSERPAGSAGATL
jgi:hypothetical protein